MAFDYEGYLRAIEEREAKLELPELSVRQLILPNRCLWKAAFPEYAWAFEIWERVMQYRQEVAPAIEQSQLVNHIFVPLVPFDKPQDFIDYFAKPIELTSSVTPSDLAEAQNLVAKAILARKLLPFVLSQDYISRQRFGKSMSRSLRK